MRKDLTDIRELIKTEGMFSEEQRSAVLAALEPFDANRKIRFRSSTNVEDSDQFVGAGLYDSFSGCVADDTDANDDGPSHCDPEKDGERGVFRAIRKVYASFYNDNAFLERLRHGVDETAAGMAVLVYYLIGSQEISDRKKYKQILKQYMNHKKEFPDVQDVSPREAMELVNTGKVVFIDVREANEQSVSRLPGAITIDGFLENFRTYNDFIKIGYATIGYRSGLIAQELHQKGIPLYNLRGGMHAWLHAGGKAYKGKDETRRIHIYSQKWDLAPDRYESVW